MVDVRIGVLGPLQVVRDGEPVTVPAGRRRAVLACLTAHAGQPVAADVLIEAAWGGSLPERPRSALHTVISRLRRSLGDGVVRAEPGGYRLAVPSEDVDALRFEELFSRARSMSAGDAAGCLRDALDLWRGHAYAEHADLDAVAAEAQRLERMRLDAAEEHAAALVTLGRWDEAAAALEDLVDTHPFRERAVGLLMTTLHRAGRSADALARYQAHRRTMVEELGLEPAAEVREVEAWILRGEGPGRTTVDRPRGTGAEGPGEVPRWIDTSSRFVGRTGAIDDLVEAVVADRSVTVTGIGGVGKTRLVAHALPTLAVRLGVPITVVELAAARPRTVGAFVAEALGHPARNDRATDDVVEYLSIDARLLVLDNCEHLLAEVAAFAEAVLRRAPGVRVLATSRHRLGTPAERVVPVAPLSARSPSGSQRDAPAVELFVDRLRRLRPTADPSGDALAAAADVCELLDGIPLAIELAASRAASIGIETVAAELATSGEAAGYLDGVVEWSARLLSPTQRRLLRQLAVFGGAVGPADVALVGRLRGWWDEDEVGHDALAELVESNLLVAHGSEDDRTFGMLSVVRSVVVREMAEEGDLELARRAHAEWVRRATERAAGEWLSGRARDAARRLGQIAPDLDAALRWAVEVSDLELAASILGALKACLHWQPVGTLGDLVLEVAERCAAAPVDSGGTLGAAAGVMASAERGDLATARSLAASVAETDDAAVRFLACFGMGVAALHAGELAESRVWLERASDVDGVPFGHQVEVPITRGILALAAGDVELARDEVATALAGTEVAGSDAARAFALYAAGELDAPDDPSAAITRFRESAAAADRIGASHVSVVARVALYALVVRDGRHSEALDLAGDLLHDARRTAAWPQVWTTLRISAELLAALGRPEDAAVLLLASEASTSAPPLVGPDVPRYAELRSRLESTLGPRLVGGLSALAAGASRSAVVDRAATVLADLRDAATSSPA